jgi:hypothetical protein
MPARALLSLALFSVALVAALACGGRSPLDTEDRTTQSSHQARAIGPSGLEQRLTVVVDPDDFREPGFHTLRVSSNVTNTGSAPVTVTARVCLFFEADVEITAQADRFEPFVSCGAVAQTTQLAPGASVGPMDVRFRLRSGPGVYVVRVRHVLDPEFRAEASFRIP